MEELHTKIVRVISLARDTPTGPPLHSYQILSKYVYGIKVMEHTRMRLRTDEQTDGRTDGRHADRYPPNLSVGDNKGKVPYLT